MRKILFVFTVVFSLSPAIGGTRLEAQQEITQFLPHFVAGSLPASDWESKILLVNLAGDRNFVTIDFFDNSGVPLAVSTNKGVGNSFTVELQKHGSSEVIEILRNTDSFVTGWAKVRSINPIGVDLGFSQFMPGATESVGKADVASSPVENVLTYPLAPNNGVALVNPGSQSANVNFTAFNRAGDKIREGNFTLARGAHKAVFFNQDPFFLEEKGVIVIASNIPLSGIAMEFDGLVFKTTPRLPTPRKLDSRRAGDKIGFAYLWSNDRQPMKMEDIQKSIAEAVYFQKVLLDKEMLLNGFNRVELPYELDSNGLPKIVMVQGGDPDLYSPKKNGVDKAMENLSKDIAPFVPREWKKVVKLHDVARGDDRIGGAGGGGSVYLSVEVLQFMDKKLFGNASPCPLVLGFTLSDCANNTLALFNHETGHGFWNLEHSAFSDDSNNTNARNMKFRSMMGRSANDGCFNPEQVGKNECALLPIEAESIARGVFSRLNDFDSIVEDGSGPTVEVIEKSFDGKRLKVVFKAEDPQSGVNSIAISTMFASPWIQYWRLVNHTDNLELMAIEVDLNPQKAGNQLLPIHLVLMNNQGQKTLIQLF